MPASNIISTEQVTRLFLELYKRFLALHSEAIHPRGTLYRDNRLAERNPSKQTTHRKRTEESVDC